MEVVLTALLRLGLIGMGISFKSDEKKEVEGISIDLSTPHEPAWYLQNIPSENLKGFEVRPDGNIKLWLKVGPHEKEVVIGPHGSTLRGVDTPEHIYITKIPKSIGKGVLKITVKGDVYLNGNLQ